MQTMNQALFSLYHRKLISLDDAMARSPERDELRQMVANPAALLKRPQSGPTKMT
jgi:twitching motility protein PilT